MEKLSFLINIFIFYIATLLYQNYDNEILTPCILYEFYITATCFSLFMLSKELMVKAFTLFLTIFWFINFITGLLGIDGLELIIVLGTFPIYLLLAKHSISSKLDISLNFKDNYIIHNMPYTWYHWVWILFPFMKSGDLEAYRGHYDSKTQIYTYNTYYGLKHRKMSHITILNMIKRTKADVSVSTLTSNDLASKLGTKINCKKEIY